MEARRQYRFGSLRSAAAAALFAVAASLPSGPVVAQESSLEAALVAAYLNNPSLLAARAELRSVDEGVPQALSGWRPTISSSFEGGKSLTKSNSPVSGSGGELRREPVVANLLEVSQPIFRGFRTLSETREAEHLVRSQRAVLMDIEQQVMAAVATAFMDVVRDQAVRQLRVSNVQVLERQLQATRDRFSVGEVTRTDVAQAEARLSRANADRVQAEGQLDSGRATYRNVVGALPGKLVQPPPLARLPGALDGAVALASNQNPAVISAKFTERAARDNVHVVGGELLPTITVTGLISRRRDNNIRFRRNDEESLTARLSVPLYQSGSVTSRLRQAKQIVGQRRMEIIVARRNAVEEATRAWHDLQTGRARVRAFGAEVKANRIALEGVMEEAAAGLRTVLDTLDAEQELLDAQVNLVGAERDEVVAGFQILAAVGQLTAADLGLKVQIYDPNRHYERVRLKLWGLGESLPASEN